MNIDSSDQALLDLICSCADRRIRIVSVKTPCRPALRRLRYSGLVGFNDYLPSASALLDWIERRRQSTAAPAKPCEEPLATAADDEGGGDARCGAPSPKRKGPPSMAERARRFEEQRNMRGASGAHGDGRERRRKAVTPMVPPATGSQTPDTATPTNEPASRKACPSARAHPSAALVDLKVNAAALPSPQDFMHEVAAFLKRTGTTKARMGLMIGGSPSWFANLLRRKAMREAEVERAREIMARPQMGETATPAIPLTSNRRHNGRAYNRAVKRVERGLPVSLDEGFQVKLCQEAILRENAEAARLADPIEQAKTLIRIRGWQCFSAVISGGPKGKYYIGNRLVDEAGLIAFAEDLRTRRRVG